MRVFLQRVFSRAPSWPTTLSMGVLFAVTGFILGWEKAQASELQPPVVASNVPRNPAKPAAPRELGTAPCASSPVPALERPLRPPPSPPVLTPAPPDPRTSSAPRARLVSESVPAGPAPAKASSQPRSLLAGFRINGIGPSGGVRLGRVSSGSLPDLLGLHTGDEILSVNGYQIANPEQAMRVYAQLPHMDRLVALLERDGKRVEVTYTLR
jgi:hypothetical protein